MTLAATLFVVATACDKKSDVAIKTTSTGETNMSAPADSAAARGHSMVRVVNAIVGGNNITLKLGDATLFDSVKPSSVTDYREVSATMAKFSAMTSAPTNTTMSAEGDKVLMDGNRYTVVYIAQDVSKNVMRILKDDVIPDSGKARVRVIHAAPGGPELDVIAAGSKDKLFSGVDFKSEAGYADVNPGTMTLEVRAKDSPKLLLSIPKLALKAGTATTIVITGAAKLASFMFTDAMMAPMTPMAK